MKKKRVLVAMSGGVDSSTAACLLLKQGYDVIGISLRLFSSISENTEGCCGLSGIEDARRVAQQLGIPFYALNCEKDFRNKVIDYFCQEYLNGKTPNPCVVCNETTKFTTVLNKAKELDAQFVATGHYANIARDKKTGRYLLKKGKDAGKDQSYFLFSLKQEQLKNTLFPLGNYTKDKVRQVAKNCGLKVHDKPGSQEICFIPDNDYQKFLRETVEEKTIKPGPITDVSGRMVGTHEGIPFYTIGQRKGIGSHPSKMYVTKIDREKNSVIIGTERDLLTKEFKVEGINWISINEPSKPIKAKVRIRYRHKESDAEIFPLPGCSAKICFSKPQKSVTPGQAAVFYSKDTVIGGGWIV